VQIAKDLTRTHAGHRVFKSKKGREALKRILTAYAWKNSSVGYQSPMISLAGFLLLFMDEESAFWLLTALVEDIVPDYYAPSMIGTQADQIVLSQLLQKKLPQLHAHFEALNVPYHQITIQWLLALFINILPTETMLRVFDTLFCEGSGVLIFVGLAIFKLKERALLAAKDFEECWTLLKVLPRSIYDGDALCKAVSEFGSPNDPKILLRRNCALREVEEQELLSNFISLCQPFRFLDGKSLMLFVSHVTEFKQLPATSTPGPVGSSESGIVTPPLSSSPAPGPSGGSCATGEPISPRGDSGSSLATGFRVGFSLFLNVLLEIDPLLEEHHIHTLFKAFDQDTRGTVDFFELICGLSIVFNGVPLQKLMVCFHAFDEDNDNQLTMKEMQLFVETHYKWLLRLLNKDKVDGPTPWHVQPTVQHDTEALWRKLRPYIEEKGGTLNFVEFRFKVATELEPLEQWLRTEPSPPGLRISRLGRQSVDQSQSALRSQAAKRTSEDDEPASIGEEEEEEEEEDFLSGGEEEEKGGANKQDSESQTARQSRIIPGHSLSFRKKNKIPSLELVLRAPNRRKQQQPNLNGEKKWLMESLKAIGLESIPSGPVSKKNPSASASFLPDS